MTKLISIYKSIINEGLSDVLWHKTYINQLNNILKTDKFILSSVGDSTSDKIGKKQFYLSTARSRTSHYFGAGDFTVFIELDGRKLGQRYKGMPVDYWQYPMTTTDMMTSKEMEDRVVSDKPEIPNASSYIKSVSILIPSEYENKIDSFDRAAYKSQGMSDAEIEKKRGNINPDKSDISPVINRTLRNLLFLCIKNDIKIYLYLKETDMKVGNVNKTIPVKDFVNILKTLDSKDITNFNGNDGAPYVSRSSYYDVIMANLLDAYYNDKIDKLRNEDSKTYIKKLVYEWRWSDDDILISIKSAVNNERRNTEKSRYYMKIIQLCKKLNIDLKEFITQIVNKWTKILATK